MAGRQRLLAQSRLNKDMVHLQYLSAVSYLFIILLLNISHLSSLWQPLWFIPSQPWGRYCIGWTEQAYGIFPNRIDLHPYTHPSACVCVCYCVFWLYSCVRQQKHVSVLTQGIKRHTHAVTVTGSRRVHQYRVDTATNISSGPKEPSCLIFGLTGNGM